MTARRNSGRGKTPRPFSSPAPAAAPLRPPSPGIPHDDVAERAALGCVLLAGIGPTPSPAEQDALLDQLRPSIVYDERHKVILAAMKALRAERHAVDVATLASQIQRTHKIEAVGGMAYLSELPEATPSWLNFPTYLATLQDKALRRWTGAKAARLTELAAAGELTVDDLRSEFAELQEGADKIGTASERRVVALKPSEVMAYEPPPEINLVGNGMITKGELTLLVGEAGLGKSRLATTLAAAGARGGTWMGYPVARRFRTLILQSENSRSRLKEEFASLPKDVEDWIRITPPTRMDFADGRFRRDLRRSIEEFKADLIEIDPWSDVTRDENFADHVEAMSLLYDVVGVGDNAPAMLIVCHPRKRGRTDKWRPKRGREIKDEVAGSFALGAKARTIFAIQAASADHEDDRVVFDCGKSNNGRPLPMSAWHRRNGEFLPIQGFDFEEWLNPADEDGKRSKTLEIDDLAEILDGAAMARARLVATLKERGFAQASIYRRISEAIASGQIVEGGGMLTWSEEGTQKE